VHVTVAALPQEYFKKPFAELDREFLLILLLSFLGHFAFIGYFLLNPPSLVMPESGIRQIQQQYANLVLEREEQAVRVANQLMAHLPAGSGHKKLSVPPRHAPAAEQRLAQQKRSMDMVEPTRTESAAAVEPAAGVASTLSLPPGSRGAVRQAEEQVAGQGLLGILTSGSRAAQDQAVTDVLGKDGKAEQNLAQVLQQVDRLAQSGVGRTSSRAGGIAETETTVRGRRTTSSGVTSEQIISNLTGMAGASTGSGDGSTRTESISTGELTPLSEEGDGRAGSGSVTGSRDIGQVSAVVYAHSQAIQYCYERELKRNPDLKGKVVVRFTILPKGTVANATILSSTLGNENVERCILSRISRWDDFGEIDERLGNAVFRQVYTFGF